MVFVSTDSEEDLSALPSDLFRFERPTSDDLAQLAGCLRYPNVWYLASKYGGCSCHYRHLIWESTDLGFAAPEEWWPEDEEDIESTRAVYDVLSAQVKEGRRVDVVDLWTGELGDDVENVIVDLQEVSREAFRFLEGHRFELR